MDSNAGLEKTSIFENFWVRLVMGLAGLVLIIIGIYQIFTSGRAKVPQDFIETVNDINNTNVEIGKGIESISNVLSDLADKDEKKDYAGAAKIATDGLAKLEELKSKANGQKTKIEKFRSLANATNDPAIRSSGLRVADLFDKRNDGGLKLIGYAQELLAPSKNYYDGLASGKKVKTLSEATVNFISKKISAQTEELSKLVDEFNSAYKDLEKATGLKFD